MSRKPLPKQCPNCGEKRQDSYGLRFGILPAHWYCSSCGWNDIRESRQVTKEQYQYYCRLTRLRFAAQQIWPPRRKQPWHILTSVMYELYARDVPYWMRQHLEHASLAYLRNPSWYFQPLTRSRWEYHSWLEDGYIKSPQEYQAFCIERREWERDNPPEYEDCEVYY